jgi:hypothetical protein
MDLVTNALRWFCRDAAQMSQYVLVLAWAFLFHDNVFIEIGTFLSEFQQKS